MQRAILAVSPNLQFLEQIRSHLEEGGRYKVQGVTTGGDALTLVKNSFFDLAILDAESSDVPFVPFTRDLVAAQPGLKLLVFPPQNNPHHPVLTGLVSNGFLKKPFFTPEVSRALKSIFDDKTEDLNPEPEPINDLAELWMKRPEVGFNRVEQLLGSTTAQTGLLIARGRVIAGSGPTDDTTIQQVLNLLDLHRLEKNTLELLRFISLENGTGEILVYAAQLIHDVILVLFYPPTTSILLARQEVFQVKQEFKEAYPTTGELRRDLDIGAEKQITVPPQQVVEELSPVEEPAPIESPADGELKSLEDEIGSEDLDSVLSLVELKNLDSLLSEMPPPDPDQDGEIKAEERAPLEDLDLSNWLPLVEDETPAFSGDDRQQETFQTEINNAIESITESETAGKVIPPPLPAEFLSQFASDEDVEGKSLEKIPSKKAEVSKFEEIAEETTEEYPGTSVPNAETSEFLFDFPWEDKNVQAPEPVQSDELLPNEVEPFFESSLADVAPAIGIDDTGKNDDDAFNAWLDELNEPASTPEENKIPSEISEKEIFPPLPEDWFSQPVATDSSTLEAEPLESADPSVTDETVPDLIPDSVTSEMDFSSFISETPSSESPIVNEPEPVQPLELPSDLPSESFNTRLSSEPGTSPLGIRNFRFHYTCLLIPRDGKQFLTRDLNERLSFLLPQLHLEYGWHLTGIAIRPQYMLWSISVPLDICPIEIIQEIRRRTSSHLFSNFPDLNPGNAEADFWAPGFLALSGSTGPTVGMIYDFIAQTRKNQNPGD